MRRAGFCSECNKNVWLTKDGHCEFGHMPSSVSGAYAVDETATAPVKMAKAGHCSKCSKNVFLTGDGHCQFGHAPESVSHVYEAPEVKPKGRMSDKDKGILLTAAAVLVLFALCVNYGSGSNADDSIHGTSNSTSTAETAETPAPQTPPPASKPKEIPSRQVAGAVATLGAGTFTGGQEVQTGYYDVTPVSGESGNFFVHGANSYNEILGGDESLGVPVVRVRIGAGDTVEVSGLSQVTFTPVATPFVTGYGPVNLYAGTFTVGEDIGVGRYIVTPGTGQQGNFFVHGSHTYNEILGEDGSFGVPSVTVNLAAGDEIAISSLNQVIFTPSQ